MTVSNVTSTTALDATAAAAASVSTSKTRSDFLKLLVTQLQNQDPTAPMDNAQMTSQIAQLNTVDGINSLNTTLQAMAANLQSSQTLQASSLLGHQVLVASSATQLAQGQAAMAVDLAQAADAMTVTITDSAGKVVRTLNLGPQAAGVQNFSWNGSTDAGSSAADGSYSFAVKATRATQPVSATTLAAGTVNSVSIGSSGLSLSVSGLGSVAMADIKQIS